MSRRPLLLEKTTANAETVNAARFWNARQVILFGTGTGMRTVNFGNIFPQGDSLEINRLGTGPVTLQAAQGDTFSDSNARTLALGVGEVWEGIKLGNVWQRLNNTGQVAFSRLPQLRQRFAFYQNSDRAARAVPGGNFRDPLNVQIFRVDGTGTRDGISSVNMWGADVWNTTENYIDLQHVPLNTSLNIYAAFTHADDFAATTAFKPVYRDNNNNQLGIPNCFVNRVTPREPINVGLAELFLHHNNSAADKITLNFISTSDRSNFIERNLLIVGSIVNG